MANNNGILSAISKQSGKKISSINFYMVIENSAIRGAFTDRDEAEGLIDEIIDSNTKSVIRESGRDEDELTEDEYNEMVLWGGFEGDHVYIENVNIDRDYDLYDEYTSSDDDTFSYSEILDAYNSASNELFNELDDYEIDDDDDEDIF